MSRRGLIQFSGSGKKGEVVNITAIPKVTFKGDKLVARDTSKVPGKGTRIKSVLVGMKNQMFRNYGQDKPDPGVLTAVFAQDVEENEWVLNTCQSGLTLAYAVEFLEDCEWSAELHGNILGSEDRKHSSDDNNCEAISRALSESIDASRPVVTHPPLKKYDFIFPIRVEGKKGDEVDAIATSQCIYKVRKLIAFGDNTLITGAFVGMNGQWATLRSKVPTVAFGPGVRGNRLSFQPCMPGEDITFPIKFLEDGVWEGVLFGEAVE